MKERIDIIKVEIEHAERGYDLNKAAELKYSVLPKLQVCITRMNRAALAFFPVYSSFIPRCDS